MKSELMEVIAGIEATSSIVKADIGKTTNKAAARRTRNNTLKLEKLFKKYRKLSIKS